MLVKLVIGLSNHIVEKGLKSFRGSPVLLDSPSSCVGLRTIWFLGVRVSNVAVSGYMIVSASVVVLTRGSTEIELSVSFSSVLESVRVRAFHISVEEACSMSVAREPEVTARSFISSLKQDFRVFSFELTIIGQHRSHRVGMNVGVVEIIIERPLSVRVRGPESSAHMRDVAHRDVVRIAISTIRSSEGPTICRDMLGEFRDRVDATLVPVDWMICVSHEISFVGSTETL